MFLDLKSRTDEYSCRQFDFFFGFIEHLLYKLLSAHLHRGVSMNTQSLRVLVADDDYPYCALIKRSLTDRGFSVTVCNSGEEALVCLQKNLFDIVLLDFKMEKTNGINVLQWMYGSKMNVPVILITSHGGDEILEEAFKWGAEEYFIKGEMDTIRLPVLVEQVYSKYQARKERVK
jgi:two-component system response regulator HydG